MKEIWKDINDFENYEISNLGRIRPKVRYLSTKVNKQGNVEVSLNKKGKSCGKMLGRLVFEAFSGQELTKDDVIIYLDGDKTNCDFSNLAVVSRSEREKMAYERGEKQCRKFDFYGEELTVRQIAEKTGMKQAIIEQRLCRRGWGIEEAAEVPVAKFNVKKGVKDEEQQNRS